VLTGKTGGQAFCLASATFVRCGRYRPGVTGREPVRREECSKEGEYGVLQIIWQSLTRRWVQSLSTLLAVAISAGILFALYLLYLGVSLGLETGSRRLGADLLVVPSEAGVDPETVLFAGAPLNIYMDKAMAQQVAGVSGVDKITPQFFTQTLDASHCDLANATRLIGFDPDTDWVVQSWVRKLPGGAIGPDDILIGAKVEGIEGRVAQILGKKFNVAAVLDPTGTGLDDSILMPIETARSLAKESPYLQLFWGKLGDPQQFISALLVDIDENADKGNVAASIVNLGGYEVIRSADVFNGIRDQMNVLFLIILGGGLLTVASAVFQFFARFFSLAWDRKGEWGLYRALGATRRDLKLLVAGEALALTLAGVASGLALGYLLYLLILFFLRQQQSFPFIEPSLFGILIGIAIIAALFVLLGIISAWFPARKSGEIEPSSAMALGDIN
jgi:putative ABC transport system permease protein